MKTKRHIHCDCTCHHNNYEFLFVHDFGTQSSSIHTGSGRNASLALQRIAGSACVAIGNSWSVQGFRRAGSKRWNKCYIKNYKTERSFWPGKWHVR